MKFSEKIRNFIVKLRALPEIQKKIIFFTIMVISALIMGFFAIKSTKNNIAKIGESIKSINLPTIEVTDSQINPPVDDQLNNTVVSQIVSQTSDWKTYTNTTYGFEIKYPKEWIFQENKMSLEYSLIFCLYNQNGCAGKRMNDKNKDEDGPIYLFTSKKGNTKPSNVSNHYLGTDSNGTDYYLFNEFFKNELLSDDMISTFKFTK